MVEFSLEFMRKNGLTKSQYETMLNLSKDVKGTPESMSHWVSSVRAMIGGNKYRRMKAEFEEYIKRDVGFMLIENDLSEFVYSNILE